MICLSTNAAIRHLCSKYGIIMTSEHGETLAKIKFDHPNLSTFVKEATDDNLSIMDYLGKRVFHPLGM